MDESSEDWEIPIEAQPQPGAYAFDLAETLDAVVALSARVPADAFTAGTLGTERAGNGVLIDARGIVLTIGYLITEATEIWLTGANGRVVAGHVLGFDQNSGFGLVQTLGRLDLPALALGDSSAASVGDRVIVAGAGGVRHSVAARIVARQAFAGYWEYLLDNAIFTAPAHPNWGGTALIGADGSLVGIGSLQMPHQMPGGTVLPLNMCVPIDLLTPVYDDLKTYGRVNRPEKPWLGLYAGESEGRIVVLGFAGDGPARRAGLREGDMVLAVAGHAIGSLNDFFRQVWSLGTAGTDVPLTLDREGDVFDVSIRSSDRSRFLKGARLH
jgi:S1-C subfamily serine protease